MSTEKRIIAQATPAKKCEWCDVQLDEEEASGPSLGEDDEIICDDCHHEQYEFVCCLCENYDENDIQHAMLVVFPYNEDDESLGVQPGVYRVTSLPYYDSPMLGKGRLRPSSLEWLCSCPPQVIIGGFPCGHLCGDCQAKTYADGGPFTGAVGK